MRRYITALDTASRDNTRTPYIFAKFNGNGTSYDGEYIIDVKIKEGLCPSSGITMGATVSASMTMHFKMPETPIALAGGYVQIYAGFWTSETSKSYIEIGEFYITDVEYTANGVVEITGYDGFYKTEKSYIPAIQFPASPYDILEDVATQCDIVFAASEITLPSITIDYVELSCRQWIGYLAGLAGANAYFNYRGYLTFKWFSGGNTDTYKITRDLQYLNGLKRTTANIVAVGSITSGTRGNVIVSGNGKGFNFENPFMTQDILDSIYEAKIADGFSYMPCNVKWRGNPITEPGDIMLVETDLGVFEPVPIMEQTVTISGGFYTEISCFGKSEEKISFQTSPTSQKIQQVYNKLQDAIAEATELLNGANGGIFEVTDADGDGVNDGWIIHSADGQKFIKANINGIGITQNGGATYQTAMTAEGINADTITTGAMNAQRISVGDASLGDVFEVNTDNNNRIVVKIGSSASDIHQEQTNDAIKFVDGANNDVAEFSTTGARWADMQEMAYCGFVWTKSAVSGNVRFTIAGSDK